MKRRNTIYTHLLIILLPFIILYWFVPFMSNMSIGNDYQGYGIREQMELLFSIKTGSFPLFAPGYAMGQSSIALTWSQIFHPITYLAYLMPGYWSGKALHWHTLYKIISLGFTQLALFIFLRNLRLNNIFAFLISFMTVYNLRMLDMIRFGPALEAYTAHLLLCAAIGWYFLYQGKLLGPIGIIVSTYLLVVSGHPQMMYYGLLGSGLFMLVVPFFISKAVFETKPEGKLILNFYSKSVLLLVIGIVSASNYVLPFYFDFYVSNAVRVGSSYEWGSSGTQSLFGVFSNFFIPFLSDVHGAFGGSFIITLAFLIPLLKIFRVRIPGIIWAIWGIVLLLLLFMLGQRTPVHKLAWNYLPFMSAFRNPGRISMIMPAFIMLLLAWLMKQGKELCQIRKYNISPYSLLSLIAVILITIFGMVYLTIKPPLGFLPPIVINAIPSSILILIFVTGFLSLILLFFSGMTTGKYKIQVPLVCLFVLIQTTVLLRFGTFMVPVTEWPTFEQIKEQKNKKLDYLYHDLPGMQNKAVMLQITYSFIEPFLGKIFTEIIPVKSQMDAYEKMAISRQPHQLFIENFPPDRAREISEGATMMKTGKVDLIYSSFNRLKFRVYSDAPAFFGLSYPHTGHWRGWVNGNKVNIYRANGAAHAVEISEGESIVEFRYWSNAFFWGMLITCSTFAIVSIFASFRGLTGLTRIIVIGLTLFVSTGIFIKWYNSLYTGDNLETSYLWEYNPPAKKINLAYGKRTYGYELPSTSFLQHHRSRAVDGDISEGNAVTITSKDKPLVIDLTKAMPVRTIKAFGSKMKTLIISVSADGQQWRHISSASEKYASHDSFEIRLSKPEIIRFLRIQPSQYDLKIYEVEVYS